MDTYDLKIIQGKTFSRVFRWAALPFIYKAITAITKAAPASLTVAGHAIPDGWQVAPVSVLGMRQINAPNSPPKLRDYKRATVVDANTVTLNAVNSAGYSAYTSGGYLQFYTPVSLAGCVARLTIRDRVGGTAKVQLDSALLGGIVLDDTAKTITVTISAVATAAFAWKTGVYDLEIEDAAGTVTLLAKGRVTVAAEVTT